MKFDILKKIHKNAQKTRVNLQNYLKLWNSITFDPDKVHEK